MIKQKYMTKTLSLLFITLFINSLFAGVIYSPFEPLNKLQKRHKLEYFYETVRKGNHITVIRTPYVDINSIIKLAPGSDNKYLIQPTSFFDEGNDWSDEALAYDWDNTNLFCVCCK